MNSYKQEGLELWAAFVSTSPALQAGGQWGPLVLRHAHRQLEQWEQQGSAALPAAENEKKVQYFSIQGDGTLAKDAAARWTSMPPAPRHRGKVTSRVLTSAEIQILLAIGCVELNPGPGDESMGKFDAFFLATRLYFERQHFVGNFKALICL
jgi:hypothetical protein